MILASPHLRTMETAELVAKQIGSAIIPTPWLHEIFLDKNEIEVFKGCNAKDLQKFFPHVIENVSMEEIWWATMVENREMVYQRVLKGITEYLKNAKEDILLVGHAVSIGAVLDYFHLREDGLLWNCCLSRYDTNHPEYNFFNDVTFLPEHMVSSNKVMRMDIDSV